MILASAFAFTAVVIPPATAVCALLVEHKWRKKESY